MANDTDDAASSRTVSPTVGVKRERLEDGEEESRRVSQRTETNKNHDDEAKNDNEKEDDEPRSLKQLVLEDLRSNDEKALVKTLDQIADFLWEEEDERMATGQKEYFFLGGHAFVVRVMVDHPDCEGIQEQGIRVFCNAAYDNKTLQTAIATVGGMEAILAAMKRFEGNGDVQEFGLDALYSLVWNGKSKRKHEANANSLLKDETVVPMILTSMNKFSTQRVLVKCGCGLLSSLCRVKALRKHIFDCDVFTILGKVRDDYKGDDGIRANVTDIMESYVEYTKQE